MKILKFGGTSLGDAARMRHVAGIVERERSCVVVCSAMAGVTNTLNELSAAWRIGDTVTGRVLVNGLHQMFHKTCFELFTEVSEATIAREAVSEHFAEIRSRLGMPYDKVGEKWLLARGEVITSDMFVRFLNSRTGSFKLLDAFRFMRIDASGEPSVDDIRTLIRSSYGDLSSGRYITQGFICLDHEGQAANLQRGGSDYTATLLGAALNVSVIEIWTDIDGIRNNDPRYVENTVPVRIMSFGEAAELAYFGAKILHPSCVWPARSQGITLHLKNTLEPDAPGTIIQKGAEFHGIRAVAAKDGIHIIRIRSGRMLNAYGFLRRVFEIFETWKTPIDVITTSEVAVSVTIDNPVNIDMILKDLKELGEVSTENSHSIVCIVGDVLAESQGYAARIMESLRHLHVKMVSFGGSRNNLTVVVPESEKKEALNALQDGLFLTNELPPIPVSDQTFFAN